MEQNNGLSVEFLESDPSRLTMSFDDGTVFEFFVLTYLSVNDEDYIAIANVYEDEDDEDDEVFLYRYSEDEDDQSFLENIEDAEYELVADAFDKFLDSELS